jgi:hypothetical protein
MKELVQAIEQNKLEAILTNVDRRAAAATSPSAKARMYNLAGDLCIDANQPERAMSYFEQAVHIHLAADQYDNAIVICKKLVDLTPQTVRAHYMPTWLTTTRGLIHEAHNRVQAYVDAAEDAGLSKLARRHLMGLTEISNAGGVLDAIAENLDRVGHDVSADWVVGELNRMNGKLSA